MATHSSVPVWRIPWPEESGRPQSRGWKKAGRDWVHFHLSTAGLASQVALEVKNPPANGGVGSIPGSWKSPGEGSATHSSILTWKIPLTEEPGGLHPVESQSVRHNVKLQHTHTNAYLMLKRNAFLLRSGTSQVCPFSLFIWLCIRNSSQYRKVREKNHTGWKGRNRIIFICRWLDYLCKSLIETTEKVPIGLMSAFSIIAGYFNIWKSITF